MKKIIIIILLAFAGAQPLVAQVHKNVASFREKELPQVITYFSQAELNDNGKLSLTATAQYVAMTTEGKQALMQKLVPVWRDSLIVVNYDTGKELWGWSRSQGKAALLDHYDPTMPFNPRPSVEIARPRPWFVYIGGQFSGDDQKNINLAINARIGFFLLYNRWDLAATYSAGRAGNLDYTSSGWINAGLMSRVHFPIRKIGLSPNIGGEIAYSVYGENTGSFQPSLVAGFSWFVGFGSINVGMNIGKQVSGAVGLTIFPSVRQHLGR